MEKRNVLLVMASVSFFLVVVVGVGLWLFWPDSGKNGSEAAAAADTLFDSDFDSFEFYRGRDELPGLMEEESAEEETTPDAPPAGTDVVFGEAVDAVSEAITIEPRESEDAPSKDLPPEVKEAPPAGMPDRPAVTTPAKTAVRPPAPAAPAAPQKVTLKEYEIQVGSFKTRKGAEGISDRLTALGLPGTIRTRDVGGETYFRVRIGPYSKKAEAEKFLGWLQEIAGFEESYISQVTRVVLAD